MLWGPDQFGQLESLDTLTLIFEKFHYTTEIVHIVIVYFICFNVNVANLKYRFR